MRASRRQKDTMMRHKVAVPLLLLASVGVCSAADPVPEKIRAIVEAEARYASFSGAVLVAKGPQVAYRGAFGYANRDFQVPNSMHTKFNIGSITKTFTALAMAQLIEQGMVDAADPLSKYLPDCPIPEKNEITIEQLLTHTAGLYDFANSDAVFELRNKRTISEITPLVYGKALLFKPGQDVAYSSGGYVLLGAVIEKVTGMTYAQYLQDAILRPAHMQESAILFPEDVSLNKAEGYKQVARQEFINRKLLDFPALSAGGLFTTAEDLFRYVRALFENRLLSAEHLDSLLTPRTKEVANLGRAAYGWWRDTIEGEPVIFHTGGTPGFSSSLYVFPRTGYVAIVLSNSFRGTAGVTDAINSALTGGFYELADTNTYDLRRGIDCYYDGDRREARLLLDGILRRDDRCRRACYYSALIRIEDGVELPLALSYLDRYLALTDPGRTTSIANAWYRKGEAYEKLGDEERALSCFQESLKINSRQEGAQEAVERLRRSR